MQQSAQTGLYPYQVSTLCGWCPLATVCPTADAAGQGVAKVPGGTTWETLGLRTVSPAHPVAAPTQTRPPVHSSPFRSPAPWSMTGTKGST